MNAVNRLVIEWQSARAELDALEHAEHPPVTDRYGRVWAWKSKDLYVHCGIAAPRHMIGEFGLPTQAALDNPNAAHFCAICLAGRRRNVAPCRPEWQCSHAPCRTARDLESE